MPCAASPVLRMPSDSTGGVAPEIYRGAGIVWLGVCK